MTTFVGYPSALSSDTKSGNFIFNAIAFNANYDIIWSFEAGIGDGVISKEVGFTTFLMNGSQLVLTGGNVGIDLGYSGTGSLYTDVNSYSVANNSLTSTVHAGIAGAVLGIGFDGTSLFALSCSVDGVQTRDGVARESIPQNDSLIIRGGAPSYNLLSNDTFVSLPGNFDLFTSNISPFVSIRCRLGNVGRTLYVDYKPSDSLDYINLKTLSVNLSVTDTTKYYVGISCSSPVSALFLTLSGGSVVSVSATRVQIKNFHVEGRYDANPTYVVIGADLVSGITTTTYNLVTEVNTLSTLVPPTSGVQDVNLEYNTESTDDSVIYVPV